MTSSQARVSAGSADRLAEAAQTLLDCARAVNAEAPGFKTGREYVTEPMALAVQALFMADVWDGPDAKVTLQGERTLFRLRGMGIGVGAAVGALSASIEHALLAEIFRGIGKGIQQRRAFQQELDR